MPSVSLNADKIGVISPFSDKYDLNDSQKIEQV